VRIPVFCSRLQRAPVLLFDLGHLATKRVDRDHAALDQAADIAAIQRS
jgi:hypothetical protein